MISAATPQSPPARRASSGREPSCCWLPCPRCISGLIVSAATPPSVHVRASCGNVPIPCSMSCHSFGWCPMTSVGLPPSVPAWTLASGSVRLHRSPQSNSSHSRLEVRVPTLKVVQLPRATSGRTPFHWSILCGRCESCLTAEASIPPSAHASRHTSGSAPWRCSARCQTFALWLMSLAAMLPSALARGMASGSLLWTSSDAWRV
mmetsp:Transcript_112713/g.329381  ORF Transcript_112713/g.329381 Transcript_112713/m.329381 type:complete len:205 (-) Transcript_112713:192-806(-)